MVTIGHSNRSLEEFTDLLRDAQVGTLVDVRKLKGSRKYPHFNEEVLREALPNENISYTWIEQLSGRRSKSREIDPRVNGLWRNQSFHNYADYTLSDEFGGGLDELLKLGTDRDDDRRVAIMCAEAVWWRCHRRLIADQLLARDIDVVHVLGPGQFAPAQLTEGAVFSAKGIVTYPPEPEEAE